MLVGRSFLEGLVLVNLSAASVFVPSRMQLMHNDICGQTSRIVLIFKIQNRLFTEAPLKGNIEQAGPLIKDAEKESYNHDNAGKRVGGG